MLDGGPITGTFEGGAQHDRIPGAMAAAIRDIDSGAAAVLPTVWLVVRRADGRILGDLGTHGPPDSEGCVEIGYALARLREGRALVPPPWAPWSAAWRPCRGSAGWPLSRVPRTRLPGACSNAWDSTSWVRFRAQTMCATR